MGVNVGCPCNDGGLDDRYLDPDCGGDTARGLLYSEKRESTGGRVLTKPVLSALFVAVALTGPRAESGYFGLVLAGLLFCMAGDVFLIFSDSPKLFLAGLVSFWPGTSCTP
jgi:hypothetical protein